MTKEQRLTHGAWAAAVLAALLVGYLLAQPPAVRSTVSNVAADATGAVLTEASVEATEIYPVVAAPVAAATTAAPPPPPPPPLSVCAGFTCANDWGPFIGTEWVGEATKWGPEFVLFAEESGTSRTGKAPAPYDLKFRVKTGDGVRVGGCDFYATGTAFCRHHPADDVDSKQMLVQRDLVLQVRMAPSATSAQVLLTTAEGAEVIQSTFTRRSVPTPETVATQASP